MSFNSKYKGAEVEALLDKVNGLTTQIIQLPKGYSWVSFYVNITLEQLMEAITPLAQEGKVIQISNGESTETISYSPESGWDGTLSSFNIRSSIVIRTAEACELAIVGEKINPLEMPITLQPGWNYISYPLDVSLSITEALGFTPQNRDIIKGKSAGASALYQVGPGGQGWNNEFNMEPGQGYQYFSNAAEPITFTYPSGGINLTTLETKADATAKLQEAKDYTDDKIDNLNKVTQTIDLVSGYNWVSFYVNITLQELYDVLGTNGISIETTSIGGISETDLINTYSNGAWTGNITELDFSKMYLINVTEAATIEVSGELLNPKDITITLNPGWNYISYPLDVNTEVNEAFKNMSPSEGDIINGYGDNTTSVYYTSDDPATPSAWWPSITLNPGKGYKYKSNAAEPITFTYPSDEIDLASLETKADAAAKLQEAKNYTDAKIQYVPNESSLPATPEEGVLYLIGEEE